MIDMKYGQLKILSKIYQTGSLSESAKQMHTSISAISRALKKCQETFGDVLFTRTYLGMIPTETTKKIMPAVQRVIEDFERLQMEQVFDPKLLTRTLSVSAADNAVFAILQPVFKSIHQQAPEMNFRILPLLDNVFRELADGCIDFALYPTVLLKELPEHYHGLNLFPVQRVCVVRKDHPLAIQYRETQQPPNSEQYLPYPKIVVELRQNARDPVFALEAQHTESQRKILEIPYFLGAPYFLETSDATLLMPITTAKYFVERLGTLAMIPIPNASQYQTRLIWHSRNHYLPEMQWIRSMFLISTQQQ